MPLVSKTDQPFKDETGLHVRLDCLKAEFKSSTNTR